MSKPKPQKIPNAADSAAQGVIADTANQPFNYLIDAASKLGQKVNVGGQDYDFTNLGDADVSRKVSDQMAQTLLDLQREKSPQIIQQRIDELKAADPQGYAARKQLFDQITQQAQSTPDRPVSSDLQQRLQDELAKGVGFNDAKQEEQVREGVRGGQVGRGIYRGAAPSTQEASTVVNAGEQLQNQRQQDALNLLQSGASPEDVAYREFQQNISNLADFQSGQTPTAQFKQVSSAANGPVQLTGGAPNTNTFNPNAAGQGISNAFSNYNAANNYQNNQANPWLAGISTGLSAYGAINQAFPGNNNYNPMTNTGTNFGNRP